MLTNSVNMEHMKNANCYETKCFLTLNFMIFNGPKFHKNDCFDTNFQNMIDYQAICLLKSKVAKVDFSQSFKKQL